MAVTIDDHSQATEDHPPVLGLNGVSYDGL